MYNTYIYIYVYMYIYIYIYIYMYVYVYTYTHIIDASAPSDTAVDARFRLSARPLVRVRADI